MSIIQPLSRPTKKQLDYLLILFNDCNFTHESRNAWLTHMFHRLIKAPDELTRGEASQVIERLKEIREGIRNS